MTNREVREESNLRVVPIEGLRNELSSRLRLNARGHTVVGVGRIREYTNDKAEII